MIRTILVLAAVAALGACADPAARIAAPDAAPSQDCRQNGSGSLVECECRQNGSGNLDCPP